MSPWPRPSRLGMPCPRSVTVSPGCAPARTSISASLVSVGTLTRAPRASCGKLTGTSVCRSAPSRSKRSSSWTRSTT